MIPVRLCRLSQPLEASGIGNLVACGIELVEICHDSTVCCVLKTIVLLKQPRLALSFYSWKTVTFFGVLYQDVGTQRICTVCVM